METFNQAIVQKHVKRDFRLLSTYGILVHNTTFMDFFIDEYIDVLYQIAIVLFALGVYIFVTIKKPEWKITKLLKIDQKGTSSAGGGTPQLNTYTVDFTQMAKDGKIDLVVGRHDEILRLAQVLSRRGKNNAMLVGPPGVGKTAIVEALAQRIASGEVPETLKGKRVLALDVATLLSGTKYRGEFEERAKKLVKEIEGSNRSIILFIDEVHSVIQSQGTEGSINFSDILKPALARGDLQMVGATTSREYDLYIKTDPALERRFQPIEVDQPNQDQALTILQGVKQKYIDYHKVEFTDAALEAAVKLTHQQIHNRTLPDKAIDAIDEAASMVRVSHLDEKIQAVLYTAAAIKEPALKDIWLQIQQLDEQILQSGGDLQRGDLVTQREQLEMQLQKRGVLVVDESDVAKVIEEWTK